MQRRAGIAVVLVVLLFGGLVATAIATNASVPGVPPLAQVDGRLVVCDRLAVNQAGVCNLPDGLAAIRIRIRSQDRRYSGLWEGPRFGGVFPAGRYTAFGSLDGFPIRPVSFRLTLGHPTRLVLVAGATRT